MHFSEDNFTATESVVNITPPPLIPKKLPAGAENFTAIEDPPPITPEISLYSAYVLPEHNAVFVFWRSIYSAIVGVGVASSSNPVQ